MSAWISRTYLRLATRGARRAQRAVLVLIAGRWARWILATMPQRHAAPDLADGEPRSTTRTRSGIYIVAVGDMAGVHRYLKMGRGESAQRKLTREAAAIEQLGQPPFATATGALIPKVRASGVARGWSYLLLTALPGAPADGLVADESVRATVLQEATRFISGLHSTGASYTVASPSDLHDWIERPLAIVDTLLAPQQRPSPTRTLGAVEDELRAALASRTLRVGPVHGDFWPSNILVNSRGELMGVVDWDSFEPRNLLSQDILHLVIYTRKMLRRTDLGAEIIAALSRPDWSPAEAAAVAAAADDDGLGPVELLRPRLLLYWLRQVSSNIERQPEQTRRSAWVRANVSEVLACL